MKFSLILAEILNFCAVYNCVVALSLGVVVCVHDFFIL